MFFGPILGSVYSVVGALSGAVGAFLIARHLGRDVIERITGRPLRFYPSGSENLIAKIVFFSRLVPVVSFDVVSYGAGLTKVPMAKFAAATALGMVPFTLVYCYFGRMILIDGWISAAVGVVFVVAFLALPRLIQNHNLLNLRRYLFPDGKVDM